MLKKPKKNEPLPVVSIVMGSKTDEDVMGECTKLLTQLKIPYEVVVTSCHRDFEKTREYAMNAKKRGIKVIVAGAGYAAALPGFIASLTDLPVIGVPIPSSPLKGIDSILSIAELPKGIPVATMGIGKGGAYNGALLAARILKQK